MTVDVMCENCFYPFKASDRALGKRVRCPECKHPVRVQKQEAEASELPAPPPVAPPRSRNAPAPPRKASRKQKTSRRQSASTGASRAPLMFCLFGGAVALSAIAFVTMRFGGSLVSGGSGGSQPRRTISREQLVFTGTSDLAISATTSEWFESLKKYHTSENPMQRTLMKAKMGNAEAALGPDPAALPEVFEALTDQHLKRYAIAILEKFGQSPEPPYFEDVVEGLNSEDPEIRRWATVLLQYVRVDDGNTIAEVTEYLNGDDAQIAASAALALGHMGPEAYPALATALKREADAPPKELIQALTSQGTTAAPSVPELVPLLRPEQSPLRTHVLSALKSIGPASSPALPELKRILLEEEFDWKGQDLYASTLVAIGPESVPVLIELIERANDPQVQVFAIETVARYGSDAAPALPALIACLTSEPTKDAANAALTPLLKKLSPTGEQLQQVFEHAYPSLQVWALDEIAANGELLSSTVPIIQRVRPRIEQARSDWTAKAAKAAGRSGSSTVVFSSGVRDRQAESRISEEQSRRQSEARAQAEACRILLIRIDQVLDQAGAA